MKVDDIMIDLHMHTKYSDGTDTVYEILKKAEENNIEVISITDHNSCKSYFELNTKKYSFEGKIICGCEFTTTYDQRLIEVLGYGFDYKIIQDFLDSYYDEEKGKHNVQILFNRLIEIMDKNNFEYKLENLHYPTSDNDFFEKSFYDEIMRYPENKKKFKEDIFDSFSDFFRKGLTNPKSIFFLNAIEFKPSINKIIDIIHKAGGVAILAHPYQYKFNDTEEFLDNLIKETEIDGFECYYTLFSDDQTSYLLNLTKRNNLLVSGGSDYHGTNKINHNLGTGRGNLNIKENILNNWNISYFKR